MLEIKEGKMANVDCNECPNSSEIVVCDNCYQSLKEDFEAMEKERDELQDEVNRLEIKIEKLENEK